MKVKIVSWIERRVYSLYRYISDLKVRMIFDKSTNKPVKGVRNIPAPPTPEPLKRKTTRKKK